MSTTVNIDVSSPVAQKDKDAIEIYGFDLSDILAGDPIQAVVWTVPAGLTKTAQGNTDTTCSITLSGGTQGVWYAVVGTYVLLSGRQNQIVLRLFIKQDAENVSSLGTALFPNRFTAVASLRRDRLVMAGQALFPGTTVSDDYLWDKLRAAEAAVQRTLRVPFQVTQFFPDDPTVQQLAALPQGMPFGIDPGYDYPPDFFQSDRWGHLQLRKRPVNSVQSVVIQFPTAGPNTTFTIPAEWLRFDRKYAQLQFIPTAGSGGIPLNAFMLQTLGMGRNIPFAIRATYRAGLENAAADYPDLIDLVLKKAVLKVVEDHFLPQSGSVSADGLSQSISVDMEKYRDMADAMLNGPKGSNGGLMAALHGVRGMVF